MQICFLVGGRIWISFELSRPLLSVPESFNFFIATAANATNEKEQKRNDYVLYAWIFVKLQDVLYSLFTFFLI